MRKIEQDIELVLRNQMTIMEALKHMAWQSEMKYARDILKPQIEETGRVLEEKRK